ncbi:MAG TPA: hypothetical protein VFV51_03330 [Vicinamibacterales bacterium]|nr:hypothetical protein [Vicinamibacterales bacterium]
MRKSGFAAVVILTFVLGLSAIGQQVDLAVEPARLSISSTLTDAIRRNDFPGFDSLYRAAVRRGEMVQQFEDVHRLWTWAMNDPTGAFYGVEMRNQFARAYPGYSRYIEQFKIIDANGNAFYPTAETRMFLLQQVETGAIARTEPAVAPRPAESVARTAPAAVAKVAPIISRPAPVVAEAPVRVAAATPVRETARPVVATSRREEAVAQTRPAAVPQEVPVADLTTPAPLKPAVAVVAPPAVKGQVPAPAPARAAGDRFALGHGIFLIIAGLLGLGMITRMLHTPATRS